MVYDIETLEFNSYGVSKVTNQNDDWFFVKQKEFISFPNCELMQFTGLKDKQRKEVYEDDIIGVWVKDINKKDKLLRHRVSFNNGAFVLDISRHMDGKLFTDLNRYLEDGYVVIGNIYENPELLSEPS